MTLPCTDETPTYDALIDGHRGPASTHFKRLIRRARAICDTCWTDNADEDWVKKLTNRRPPTRTRKAKA